MKYERHEFLGLLAGWLLLVGGLIVVMSAAANDCSNIAYSVSMVGVLAAWVGGYMLLNN